MPGSNTSYLPQTLVSLPWEFLCVPAACHAYHTFPTFEAVTFRDTDDINHLILVEDGRYGHSLLQVLLRPLHLHDSHLEADGKQLWKPAILLHGIEVFVKLLLACLVLPLLSILSEGLLLALIPETQKIFIKSALALVTQVLSKDGFQGAQTTDRFDVSHNTHHNDRRNCLKSCIHQCLHTEGSAVHLSQRVGHARLISQEGSEVDGMAGVIFGQEPHVPVARSMEFAMRLKSTMELVHTQIDDI
uniref:Uncharacterized protein n=1 Tax=Pundamilia nyererei TaxID=303518 RepID=A0A3B4GJ30_9CICH